MSEIQLPIARDLNDIASFRQIELCVQTGWPSAPTFTITDFAFISTLMNDLLVRLPYRA